MNKEILILGASGLLGKEIYNFLGEKNCAGTTFRKDIKNLIRTDLTAGDNLEKVLEEVNPEIIINCLNLGGFLDPNPEQTKKVNYEINEKLSKIFNKKIIFFSTDSVFDGERGDYIETDKPNPINNYGTTKYLGEQVLLQNKKNSLILRLGILYRDVNSGGYMKFVYDNLSQGKMIDSWKEIVSCPTHIDDVCTYMDYLLKQDASGIYHLVGSEKMSRYDFAIKIADKFGLNKSLINCPVYSGEIKRPKDTSMKSIRLKTKLRGIEFG
ncbi:MAG: SDR family oxidoreductase [Candidatus Nanoarchaeia archaeon]|nr:SDR family oxidoreductase [Candidatus Nanoarchaeia archaeon]MDD5358123.1 SDR family oxidoreductase [Candidatus Nanoarchaeia archaeon]MDD5589310.1 SDR family oxidoreductase [Candidatus Nanoarchaeia archaeon]